MTKTPSALKWLAEKRARLAADTMQAQRVVQEFTARHQKLLVQLAALDETIRVYDAALTPSNIEPVAHWKGRHGKRGELQQAFLEILAQHSPDWVSANSIELFVVSRFGLSFASSEERATWRANCLGNGLWGLARKGLVERQDDPGQRTGKCGYWRSKQPPLRAWPTCSPTHRGGVVKKTPFALKWLAETRARLAHDLADSERVEAAVVARTAKLRDDLAALDRTLTVYDPAIRPENIEGVQAHRAAYGKRDNLIGAIQTILQGQAPNYVSTEMLAMLLSVEFNLEFETRQGLSHFDSSKVLSTYSRSQAATLSTATILHRRGFSHLLPRRALVKPQACPLGQPIAAWGNLEAARNSHGRP